MFCFALDSLSTPLYSAEVGLLTHNVVVEGSTIEGAHTNDLGDDQYGVHVMVHRVGTNTTQVRFVLFFYCDNLIITCVMKGYELPDNNV